MENYPVPVSIILLPSLGCDCQGPEKVQSVTFYQFFAKIISILVSLLENLTTSVIIMAAPLCCFLLTLLSVNLALFETSR